MIYVTRNYINRLAIEASKMENSNPIFAKYMRNELEEINTMVEIGEAKLVVRPIWRMEKERKRKRVILEDIQTGRRFEFKDFKSAGTFVGKSTQFMEFAYKNNIKIDCYILHKD